MRFLSRNKQTTIAHIHKSGFTLIEVLIIAPIVMLVIGGFVALMISMIGDVLITRDQNAATFDTQDALDRIEEDTRLTTQFLVTSGTFTAPQGSNSNFTGTSAFSSSNTLIMGGLTTDKNPTDNTRQLVYFANQPNDCGTTESYNRIFQGKIMYFIKDGSLWRRIVLPNFNLNAVVDDNTVCRSPWQQNSCSPGYLAATRCQTNDIKLVDNVTAFSVKYLATPSSSTDLGSTQATTANAIEVTLTTQKTTAGKTISNSGTVRATKLNNIDVDAPIPDTPDVKGNSEAAAAVFKWDYVPTATSFALSYNINGGAWVNSTVNNRTLTLSINAKRTDTVTLRVTARNSTGNSPYGTATVTMPAWYECPLQNGWANYAAGYQDAGYTKTTDYNVMLKGLVRSGGTGQGTVICTLPVGYRPNAKLAFQVSSDENRGARVDINTNGDITVEQYVTNGWLSLDGVSFLSSDSPYTWSTLPLSNGWTFWGAPYSTLRSAKDSVGRVHVQGLVRPGSFACDATVGTLPTGSQANELYHYPATSNRNSSNYIGINNTTINAKCLDPAGYYSAQMLFYPSGFSGWSTLTLQNGWVPYSATHTQPRYTKSSDGMVTVKGLIRSGAVGSGSVIATLPRDFRPKNILLMSSISNGEYGRIDILPNGNIITRSGSNAWYSLDNISFMAESQDVSSIPTNGLVGYYPLNGNALDSSGNNYNGTVVNATPTTGQNGVANTAMQFNGTSAYINLGNPAAFPSARAPRSMCAWVKTDSLAGGFRIVASYGTAGTGQSMFIAQNGTTLYAGGYGDDISVPGFWALGNWRHVCNVYNGTYAYLIVDSIYVIATVPKNWNLVKTNAFIGLASNGSESWAGAIDDLRIYNRALEGWDMSNLYFTGPPS